MSVKGKGLLLLHLHLFNSVAVCHLDVVVGVQGMTPWGAGVG